MYQLHTSTQALGEKSLQVQTGKKPNFSVSYPPSAPFLLCLWKLSELGQLWDPFQFLSQPPKAARKAWPLSWCPRCHSLPEVSAVSQGNGRLPHGTGTGCAVAVEGEELRGNLGNPLRQTLLPQTPCSQCSHGKRSRAALCCQAV